MPDLNNDLNLLKPAMVFYREPDAVTTHFISGVYKKLHGGAALDGLLTEEGFVISPFDSRDAVTYVVAPDASGVWEDEMPAEARRLWECCVADGVLLEQEQATTRQQYMTAFERLQSFIQEGTLTKAILSRVHIEKEVALSGALALFQCLCANYPRAFVYLFHVPELGVWMGASPEILFTRKGDRCQTVSLAGTIADQEQAAEKWTAKELDEQAVVTNYIASALQELGIEAVDQQGPFTVQAGKVAHLKTLFEFSVDNFNGSVGALVQRLHPTPAVCGWPREQAFAVIRQLEQHNRLLYAGFIGPVGKNSVNLYVNIRCLRFVTDGVALYLGGGITAGSEVESEWQETEMKAQTLLEVIKNMRNLQAYDETYI
ncbi:isochorismate synthase [Marinilabiliaceae bacterium JC017]|nr:isochorismate synthase [Marinilabiliaceae bacterium JC017]